MEVHEILNGKEKVVKFLEEKGFQRERDYSDEEYPGSICFEINKEGKKSVVVYEVFEEEKIKEVKDHFLRERSLSHCIIFFEGKLIFLRNFGERRHFIYSKNTQGVSKVSKENKLKKIRDEGFDFIFYAGDDISSRFYESFKNKRDILVRHIINDTEPQKKFLMAHKIFDRFFFIYFLCHKEIIKLNGEKISGENLFNLLLKEDNFFLALKSLFDKFNTQGEGEIRILKLGDYNLDIPYLNGGLFRPHNDLEKALKITLKNKEWKEIFGFLSSYHWIIEDAKITEEQEDMILTPEILGHVYERSVVEWESEGFEKEAENIVKKITERKKKGVYYTPESITDYISNNTIIPYLLDKLKNKYKSFDELIEFKNKEKHKGDMEKALRLLNEIKVLDPACGSGAFLIKASEVILNLKIRLNYGLKNKTNTYDLKLDIITGNIYGVDILAGAVEISKLRLWLWLISDYEGSKNKIKALPNIEYNLMQGNSLIGFTSFKGKLLEVSKELKEKTKRFEELKSEYKTSHGKTSEIIRELLEKEMKSVRSELNLLYIKDLISMGIEDFKVKKDIQFNFLGEETKSKHEKFIYRDEFERELTPFHWVLEFSEVFKSDNPGFDIVIGNPPYISFGLRDVGKLPDYMKRFYNIIYSNSSEYKINIYPIFIQRGIDLTNEYGRHSFIVPDSFLLGRYFSKIRKYILDKCKINKILFLPYKVFPGATIGVSIIYIFEKNKISNNNQIKPILAYNNNQLKNEGIKNYSYSQGYFKTTDYNRFRLFFDKETMNLILKIEKNSKKIENFMTGRTGVRSLIGQKKIISKSKKDGNWKRGIISSSQVLKYCVWWDGDYINIDPKLLNSGGWDYKIMHNKKLFIRQTGDSLTATIDLNGFYHLNNVHSFALDNNKLDILYILAIFNSKLLNKYYQLITLEEGRAMAQTDIETLEKLPIKEISLVKQQPFIKLVDKILSITKDKDYPENKEKNKKVGKLQEKIDKMVYELYELTPEEIKIIENFKK